jgi:hypothetical protein
MPSVIPTQQIQDLFKPFLGQLAWNIRGGVGSRLTLEFVGFFGVGTSLS